MVHQKQDEIQLRKEQNGVLKNWKHTTQIKNRNEWLGTLMEKKKNAQATMKQPDYLLAMMWVIFLSVAYSPGCMLELQGALKTYSV